MKRRLTATLALLTTLFTALSAPADTAKPIAIAVHGGAGTMRKDQLDEALEQRITAKLREATEAGHARLAAGASAVDAVVAAIAILEASPLFNAGVGAVYTWDGTHELDASIMTGDTRAAGAVAGVRTIASPIHAARAVMEHSPHVLLSGTGAEAFAQSQGLKMVANSHFDTPERLEALQRAKARAEADKHGTVGAVALDAQGNLAAGTSTGGMTGKRWGRVGDSPIIGAGTFADNASCAVSATGHGEYFIRYNVAADICARVAYKGLSIEAAGHEVIQQTLLPAGGTGGVIILDAAGNISMPFNTEGMYRAAIDPSGKRFVGIYR